MGHTYYNPAPLNHTTRKIYKEIAHKLYHDDKYQNIFCPISIDYIKFSHKEIIFAAEVSNLTI